jgi:hypothetical protein
LAKFENNEWLSTYKTESQLFPKKCGVKLHEHLNHGAGKNGNFLKNGQDLQSQQSRKVNNFRLQKGADVKLKD